MGAAYANDIYNSPAIGATGNNITDIDANTAGNQTTNGFGALYFDIDFGYDVLEALNTWISYTYAMAANVPGGYEKGIGMEIDFGAKYMIRENFDLGMTFAFLIPGKYFEYYKTIDPAHNTAAAYGIFTNASITF